MYCGKSLRKQNVFFSFVAKLKKKSTYFQKNPYTWVSISEKNTFTGLLWSEKKISLTNLNCHIAKHHFGVIEESFTIHTRVNSLNLVPPTLPYTYLYCRIAKHHFGVVQESFTIHARVTSLNLYQQTEYHENFKPFKNNMCKVIFKYY